MNILDGWDTSYFKGDILRHASSSNHFDLIISWLPDIVQKSFCTLDRAMDPTFQMFVAREIRQKLRAIFVRFFWPPFSRIIEGRTKYSRMIEGTTKYSKFIKGKTKYCRIT